MSSGTPFHPSPEGLLGELDWVRRLARRLVDAEAAEDVAQETMLAALSTSGERGQVPGGARHRRAWLSRVARNIALNWRRSARRRQTREATAARPEASSTSSELLARTEMHQELVRQVQELPDPFRTVILLRYLEDCTPREIAVQLGEPASTVRSRLARGLELLRERLDSRHGRETWMGALALPSCLLAPASLSILGTLMKSKSAFASGLILLSGLALYVLYAGLLAPPSPDPTAVGPVQAGALTPVAAVEKDEDSELLESDQRQAISGSMNDVPDKPGLTVLGPAWIHGAFRLLGEKERAQGGLDGEAEFLVWNGSTAQTRSHAVRGGRFEFELDEGCEVEVVSLMLGGVPALPMNPGRRYRADQSPLAIDVRATEALVLVVLDGASGTHVHDVEVMAEPAQLLSFSRAAYPESTGVGKALVRGEPSPVSIVPSGRLASMKDARLHVRAPGYAWSSVVVDFTRAGERRVELEPGAGADVFLDGADVPREGKLVLRLGASEGQPDWIRVPGEERRFALEGLQTGEHTVSLEFGDWWDEPKVLGSATFLASPVERAQVVLAVEALEPAKYAPLAGVLVLPAYWRERNEALHLREVGSGPFVPRRELSIDEMESVAGEAHTYAWDAGQVKTGRYELSLPEPFVPMVIEVGPAGVRDARLVIGAPGRLSVDVVDDATGLTVDGVTLSWITKWPKGGGGGRREMAELDPETGLFEILAPTGEIDLLVLGRYSADKTLVNVGPSPRTYTMRVRRNYRLSVVLQDGDRRVPLPVLTELDFEHLDGDGKRVSFGMDAGESFIDFDQPGRYRFVVPPLDGYLVPDPQIVELTSPKRLVHVVPLTRE